MESAKTVVFTIRMTPQDREALKRAAKADGRTAAALARKVVLEYIEWLNRQNLRKSRKQST
jgi:predicted DNA-binding protein